MSDTSAQVEEKKQVESELDRLKNAVAQKGMNLSELQQRLSDVLMEESVKEDAIPDAPEEILCTLAGKIRNVRMEILNQDSQVQRVTQRLEL